MSNILFYSDKCQFSMSFIQKLKDEISVANKDKAIAREKFLRDIKLINVLTLNKIPDNIETVPTILVNNINVPLSGADAFAWLEKSKYFYQPTNNINTNINVKKIDNVKDTYYQDQNQTVSLNDKNKKSDVFANLKDEDDEKITKTKFNGATQNISITNLSIKETIDDTKIDPAIQNKNMDNLVIQRKYQMQQFINKRR